jgi:hypothetical protein
MEMNLVRCGELQLLGLENLLYALPININSVLMLPDFVSHLLFAIWVSSQERVVCSIGLL